jgi:hypothetical protein
MAMDRLTLIATLAFLAATSILTHLTHQPWLGFVLAPVPLLFYSMGSVGFMFFALACYLLFYEAFAPGSNFIFFNTPDSLIIVFAGLALFNNRTFPSFGLPFSRGLVPLYAFILYGLALSIQPLIQFGADYYVMRDIKNILFLLLVPLLCRRGDPLFDARNLYLILVAFVVLTSLHSAVLLLDFIVNASRPISWNEVFLADAVLMIPVLLSLDPGPPVKKILYLCMPVCLLGLLATQTRGLWLSSMISFAFYLGFRLTKTRTLKLGAVLKVGQSVLGLLLLAEVILRATSGVGVLDFVQTRMMAHSNNEFINPYSSLGYRIHESLVVWEKRTWFGHGSGARLYLFFTQLGMSKFVNWWSIHSDYFEILHKYGFIGLGIFMWFILGLIRRSLGMAMKGKAFPSAMGFLVFTTLINHCLVSITSGYLIRESVMLYMVLITGIVERYHPRVFPSSLPAER